MVQCMRSGNAFQILGYLKQQEDGNWAGRPGGRHDHVVISVLNAPRASSNGTQGSFNETIGYRLPKSARNACNMLRRTSALANLLGRRVRQHRSEGGTRGSASEKAWLVPRGGRNLDYQPYTSVRRQAGWQAAGRR